MSQAIGHETAPPSGPRDSNAPQGTLRETEAPDSQVSKAVWRDIYARRLALTDLLILVVTTGLATWLRFGMNFQTQASGHVSLSYVSISLGIAASWWFALAYFRTRDPKIVGDGADEYRRIVRATFVIFGWIAIVSLLFKSDLSRGYLAATFPIGLVGLLLGRKLWRGWLLKQRRDARCVSDVLVIGGSRSAKQITENLDTHPNCGYRVTGVWVPDRPAGLDEWLDIPGRSIPIMGTSRSLADALRMSTANAVIVTDTEHLGQDGLKSLAWDLEGADVDLMVSPNVIDVVGPRIHLRAVASMPLIHLEEPQYSDASRWGKVIFDKVIASTALLAASPVLLTSALAIKLTSTGPVLYRSPRIGVGGRPFDMLKLRSMSVDADTQRSNLLSSSDGAGPLFKIKDDPRVTRVGRVLRRYSIDELPQLLNVLKGEMSLVGPRPPLPEEVAAYQGHVERRLLVRQGITGQWQVSGRSDLTWEESVRMDLDYVENWSMTRDLHILWRTVRAVRNGEGAY